MALDSLCPPDDEFLTPGEVVKRLDDAFPYVWVDRERGRRGVAKRIEYQKRLKQEGKNPFAIPIGEQIEYLESLVADAVYVTFAEEEEHGDAFLSTNVLPGEPISFGYVSATHQEVARPLLERCMNALGYVFCD